MEKLGYHAEATDFDIPVMCHYQREIRTDGIVVFFFSFSDVRINSRRQQQQQQLILRCKS